MTKFYNYINEERTKTIHADDAFLDIVDHCSRNYKKMFNSINSTKIYRGLQFYDDFGYVNSNKGKERRSAHTENYYTLLIDNLPSWKGWPKRSRGIVCSTKERYASNYGHTFYAIPYDNAKIGICSSYDIWESFKNPDFQKYFGDLNNFNYVINKLLFYMLIKTPKLKNPANYKQLKELLIEISKLSIDDYPREKYYNFFNQKDIMKHLNNVLDPKKNGFQMGIENLKNSKEVWIQGDVILVSHNGYEMILEDLHNYFWG